MQNNPLGQSLPKWRTPAGLLYLFTFATGFSFGVWIALFNNFAVDTVGLNGADIGLLQSWREIPGFMAFAVVWVLLLMSEQRLALLSVLMLGVGVLITGYLASFSGLLLTTMLMSVGFHYYETIKQSLSLQWFDKTQAPVIMGNLIGVNATSALLAYFWCFAAIEWLALTLSQTMLLAGSVTVTLVLAAAVLFPTYTSQAKQHKKLLMRRRYWLYYLLTFMGGARRQIFFVFAALLLVEKFNFGVQDIALVFIVNGLIQMWLAPKIGHIVVRFGERKCLIVEYLGLIFVFASYAWVTWVPAVIALYVIDNMFFSLSIAQNSYLKKIADVKDMASTAGVAFTINHVAAVVLPAVLGVIWLWSPIAVFMCGAVMAGVSLYLALWVPDDACPGAEWQAPPRFKKLLLAR